MLTLKLTERAAVIQPLRPASNLPAAGFLSRFSNLELLLFSAGNVSHKKKQPALVSTFVPLLLFSSLPHVHSAGSGRSDAMTSIRKGKRLNVRTADGSETSEQNGLW